MSLVFHKLISLPVAKSKILKYAQISLNSEHIPVTKAINRILSTDIVSAVDSPPFDRSEVDGYAVRASDIETANEDNPVYLKVCGKARIGEKPQLLAQNCAMLISTGAIVPAGADSVVMVEYTKLKNDTVAIYRSTYAGENISQAGSDVRIGEIVVRKGAVIGAREIGILSTIGVNAVNVQRLLKIAIFSTGNELVEPGSKLTAGKIYEVNGALIKALLEEIPGVHVEYLGIIKDNISEIEREILTALKTHDIVLTSGSTSAGEEDLIYHIFRKFKNPGILFHGLQIKPGKPTICAIQDKKIIMGLPGFPVSATMVVQSLLIPVIYDILKIPIKVESTIRATLPMRVKLVLGKTNLIPVNLVKAKDYTAYPVVGDSGSIYKLAYADGYIEAPDNREYLNSGEQVNVKLFSTAITPSDLVIMGSHDPGVDIIVSLIQNLTNPKLIYIGSMGGVIAISRGEAHIAGVHLLDEKTLEYNKFLLKKYHLDDRAILVRGYSRAQGLLVAKGNPYNIKSFKDIVNKDVLFINRNQGSGTRTLIDCYLKMQYGEAFKQVIKHIRGYTVEAKTHSAVGAAVAQNRADVGVAIEYIAKKYDLQFIPLQKEHYDFLILKNLLNTYPVQRFLEILKSKTFHTILQNNFSGYTIDAMAGTIIK